MTPEEYSKLLSNIYKLIVSEIEKSEGEEDLAMIYPKLITMYEFFRLLRGEAFIDARPSTPDKQKDFYKMEDDILKRINSVKRKVNFDDERVKHYIDLTQKSYSK